MTAAEFATLRGACGLTYRSAGEYLDVSFRSVQRWEDDERLIPLYAANQMMALDDKIRSIVGSVLAPYTVRYPPKTRVNLIRYQREADYLGSPPQKAGLPFGAYEAVLWRIIDGLSRLKVYYAIDWAPSHATT